MTDTKITLLAVDDEPNNLRALKIDLEESGYHADRRCRKRAGGRRDQGWRVLLPHQALRQRHHAVPLYALGLLRCGEINYNITRLNLDQL